MAVILNIVSLPRQPHAAGEKVTVKPGQPQSRVAERGNGSRPACGIGRSEAAWAWPYEPKIQPSVRVAMLTPTRVIWPPPPMVMTVSAPTWATL